MAEKDFLPTNEWIRDKLEEELFKQACDYEGDLYAVCDELRESFISNHITTLEACIPCLLTLKEMLDLPAAEYNTKAFEIYHKHSLTKDQMGAVTSILAWILTGLKFDMRDPDIEDDDAAPYIISSETARKIVNALIEAFLKPKVLESKFGPVSDDSFVGLQKEEKVIVKKTFVGF